MSVGPIAQERAAHSAPPASTAKDRICHASSRGDQGSRLLCPIEFEDHHELG